MCFFSQVPLAIRFIFIVTQHFPPKIGITTATHQGIVRCFTKAVGGTAVASTQTSMVCTSRVGSVTLECAGTTGEEITSLLRDPRWRFVQRISECHCRMLSLFSPLKIISEEMEIKISVQNWLCCSFLCSFYVFNWQPQNIRISHR